MKTAEHPAAEAMLVLDGGAQVFPMVEEGGGGEAREGGGGAAGAEAGRRLGAAAGAGDVALVRALMAGGAPLHADWLGSTPLHAAAQGGHADCVRVLLRAGVSRDARTKVERTPLHVACALGHAAAAGALLRAGADHGARDMLRMTPLHWAAQRGHEQAARLLLREGASQRARNKFGLTPRQLAARAGHLAVIRAMDEEHPAPAPRSPPRSPPAEPAPPTPPEFVGTGRTEMRADDAAEPPKQPSAESPGSGLGPGAALLRQHGITLLPRDDTPTVLRALRGGRTLVLSDAGKLMLQESGGGGGGGGVVVKATLARSPPRPGVKVFTLSSKAGVQREGKTVRKVIHPKDLQLDPSWSRGVKLVMNRANFRRLVTETGGGTVTTGVTETTGGMETTGVTENTEVIEIPEETEAEAKQNTGLQPESQTEPEPSTETESTSTESLVKELLEARAAERMARVRLAAATRRVQQAETALRDNGFTVPQ